MFELGRKISINATEFDFKEKKKCNNKFKFDEIKSLDMEVKLICFYLQKRLEDGDVT